MSSASYHVFALLMDLGLIPFMAIDAFFAEKNWSAAVGTDGRWRSIFDSTGGTTPLLLATCILSMALGALHLLSLALDIYLVLIFRKIANYPSDMNPLEDNLTSRAAVEHTHTSTKKFASLSGSTLALSGPNSQNPTQNQPVPDAGVRPMSFYQSRVNHNQDSTYMSRATVYQQSDSSRGSRAESLGRPAHDLYTNINTACAPMPPTLVTCTLPGVSTIARPSRYSNPLRRPQEHVPSTASQPHQKELLLNENWCTARGSQDEDDLDSGDLSADRHHGRQDVMRTPAMDADDEASSSSSGEEDHNRERRLLPQPLRMNPPNPPSHQPQLAQPHPYALPNPQQLAQKLDHTVRTTTDADAFYFSDTPSTETLNQGLNLELGILNVDSYGNSHPISTNSNDNNVFYDDADLAETQSTYSRNSAGTIGRALTITSAISAVSSLYSRGSSRIAHVRDTYTTPLTQPLRAEYVDMASHPDEGPEEKDEIDNGRSPKRKTYTDLAAATKGVRGFTPPSLPPMSFSGKGLSIEGVGISEMMSLVLPQPDQHFGDRSHSRSSSRDYELSHHDRVYTPQKRSNNGGRVISRTGVDLADANVLWIEEPEQRALAAGKSGVRGRRNVSGKVAEDGMAGSGSVWWGTERNPMRRREAGESGRT